MKKIIFFLLLLYACPEPWQEEESAYTPVYMDRTTLENSVRFEAARNRGTAGKIYYKDNKIYISEQYKGVHIINNTDPKHPKNEAFITVAGCVDMAIKGDILFVDNAVDLVSIDLVNKRVTKRLKNVFPEPTPPDLSFIPSTFRQGTHNQNMVIVAWELKK